MVFRVSALVSTCSISDVTLYVPGLRAPADAFTAIVNRALAAPPDRISTVRLTFVRFVEGEINIVKDSLRAGARASEMRLWAAARTGGGKDSESGYHLYEAQDREKNIMRGFHVMQAYI